MVPLHAFLRDNAVRWAEIKLELSRITGLGTDVLHIHVGVLVLCIAALALRRHPISIWPWLALLVLEISNELADLMLDGMGSEEATLGAGLHDLLNTMAGPTLLLLVAWLHHRLKGNARTIQP